MEDNKLLFYHEWEEYGELSNYYVRDMIVDGVTWASNEHYYQSQKTLDPQYAQLIHDAPTPDDAKNLGNAPECVYRPDWDTWKIIAMRKGLFAKFTQNEDLKKLLLDTGDKELHENSMRDYYWGVGADGTGLTMLGKLLMALREELRYYESK